MITRHIPISRQTRILDLACGKGAVSVNLARELGCKVKGIDIMPDFISFAVQKAREFGVDALCEFVAEDITESVEKERDYDIVILGAVGDVLGRPEETIALLKRTVKSDGHIIIDDAYGNEKSDSEHPTREHWLDIFARAGVVLVDERVIEDDELASLNKEQQEWIEKRANELKVTIPGKAQLFDSYIHSQLAECKQLEDEISGVTLLLQVIA
jgi:ubiquinone/menaquinone biosynthesis C-methylase UbiE